MLAWFYVAFCFVKYKPPRPHKNQIRSITRLIKTEMRLDFRYIREKEELKQISELDNLAYGEYSISYDVLFDWWQKYPKGIFTMCRGHNLLGAIGLWPLAEATFEDIKESRKREQDLRSADIISQGDAGTCQSWHCTGFLVNTKEDILDELLYHGLSSWIEQMSKDMPIRVTAKSHWTMLRL